MPLPLKPEDLKKSIEESKQKGFLTTVVLPPGAKPKETVLIIMDLLGYNKVIAYGIKFPLVVRAPGLYEEAVKAFERGKLLKARVLLNKIDIIDVLETEEVDPETLEHNIYNVRLSPWGSLVLVDREGRQFFIKPVTENAKDLASLLMFHTNGATPTLKMIIQKLGSIEARRPGGGGIVVLQAALFAWSPYKSGEGQEKKEEPVAQKEEKNSEPAVEEDSGGGEVEEELDVSVDEKDIGAKELQELDGLADKIADLILEYKQTGDKSKYEEANLLVQGVAEKNPKLLDILREMVEVRLREKASQYGITFKDEKEGGGQ